jgi:5-methyltetrahydrofolate--homocysteine methyltransferase
MGCAGRSIMTEVTSIQQELQDAIIRGNAEAGELLIRKALSKGFSPKEIMNSMMIPAMNVVGDRFSKGEIYLPEMMIAARAMNTGLDILRPLLLSSGVLDKAKVVIGTVKGDVHDVGKNIVGMMLQSAGYELLDLGIDVSPEKFVNACKTHEPQFVLFSALLTLTMPMMGETINALQKAGLRGKVKVGVGGAPVTEGFAVHVGADFYGQDAWAAVIKCNELIFRAD